MSDVLFIAPPELAMAMRLAGGTVIPARTVSDLREAIAAIGQKARPPVMVLAPEHLTMRLEAGEIRDLVAGQSPFFIPVPMDWRGTRDIRGDLEDWLRYLLGFRIPLPEGPAPEGVEDHSEGRDAGAQAGGGEAPTP